MRIIFDTTEDPPDLILQVTNLLGEYFRRTTDPFVPAVERKAAGNESLRRITREVINEATDVTRNFLLELAAKPDVWQQASVLAKVLGHNNTKVIPGVISVITRKVKNKANRDGLVPRTIVLFERKFDGTKVSYKMTKDQADRLLELHDIGDVE